jgi:hypothetical protein
MTTEAIRMRPGLAASQAEHEAVAETSAVHIVEGLVFLTGLYLAISPWVVGFTGFTTLTGNDLITGIALAVVSLGFASPYSRAPGLAWVTPVIGVWTIIAPWVVSGAVATTATDWSNVVAGVIAVLLGLGAMFLRMGRIR